MQRDDALRLLRDRREQLRSLGVGQLFLYGSVARNEARDDSDVDLLVEPSNQRFSIFDLVRVRDLCRTILGTRTDIHDYDGLRRLPEFQASCRRRSHPCLLIRLAVDVRERRVAPRPRRCVPGANRSSWLPAIRKSATWATASASWRLSAY